MYRLSAGNAAALFDMTVLEYMKFAADLKKIPKNKKTNR